MKKSEKKFSALVSRILFFQLGLFALFVSVAIALWVESVELPIAIICLLFFIGSSVCFYAGCILDDKSVSRWGDKTGNHEILIVFAVLSFFLASLIQRVRGET